MARHFSRRRRKAVPRKRIVLSRYPLWKVRFTDFKTAIVAAPTLKEAYSVGEAEYRKRVFWVSRVRS